MGIESFEKPPIPPEEEEVEGKIEEEVEEKPEEEKEEVEEKEKIKERAEEEKIIKDPVEKDLNKLREEWFYRISEGGEADLYLEGVKNVQEKLGWPEEELNKAVETGKPPAESRFKWLLSEIRAGLDGFKVVYSKEEWPGSAEKLCEIYGFDNEKIKQAIENGQERARKKFFRDCSMILKGKPEGGFIEYIVKSEAERHGVDSETRDKILKESSLLQIKRAIEGVEQVAKIYSLDGEEEQESLKKVRSFLEEQQVKK